MSAKIKILFLSYWPVYYIYSKIFNYLGGRYPDLEIVNLLAARFRGIQVDSINFRLQFMREMKPFESIVFQKIVGSRALNLTRFPELGKLVREMRPDLIASLLYYSFLSIQGFRCARQAGAGFILMPEEKPPFSLEARASMPFYNLLGCEEMLQEADWILPWTLESEAFFKQKAPPDRVRLYPAGVDLRTFYPSPDKKFKSEGRLKILVVANFYPFKNHTTLIRAFGELRKSNFSFRLDLIGQGPLRDTIGKLSRDYGISDSVFFLERLDHSKMRGLYLDHDLLILPSLKEPIGMCVPEAMACGIPVIVSTGVTRTYIEEGRNALVFEAKAPLDLAEKVKQMDDPAVLRRLGENASEHMQNFSLEKRAEELLEYFLSARPGRTPHISTTSA